jgi:hypothetical protein
MKRSFLLALAAALVCPTAGEAHVKWFCAYDTTIPPVALQDVLTPAFVFVAAWFATLMFLAYLVDQQINRHGWLKPIERCLLQCVPLIPRAVRIAVCIFFLVLWIGGNTILTPELKTTSVWVPWLQLAIAASTLWRRTLIFAAAGITVLYVYAVRMYGAFHMMDYPIFLGLAIYLGLDAFTYAPFAKLKLPALYFNVTLTMMWGAVEKFAYPYWTFPLLADHRALTLGIPFDKFMIIAGFVEFSLAFFMLTGTALLRLSCLALLTLMASAIPEFGKIDAIGHFLILVTLAVMIIAGQSGVRLPGVHQRGRVFAYSGTLTFAYGLTLACLFGVYYGAQFVAGR